MSVLKKFVQVLIVIALAYGVGRFIVVYKDSHLAGEREPYLQMLTQNSVTIRWMTDSNQLGVVHYGEDRDNMASIEIESQPTKIHSATLSGLKPATRYFYQVDEISGVRGRSFDKHWFYTHPAETVATRIWVLGDSGQAGNVLNQVRDSAFNWMKANPLHPVQADTGEDNSAQAPDTEDSEASLLWADNPFIDVWISLGDIAYRSGSNQQFQVALFDTFDELTANTALYPVYGNHDDRRWTYFRIFDLPEKGEAGGLASGTENYYAIDYSNVHIVMLDSQDSDLSATGEMAVWLKQDLAQNSQPWLIAAFHHPPYSKGTHDSDDSSDSSGKMRDIRKNIVPILEQAGVDLVLSGHSHMYERSHLIDCAYSTSASFTSANIVSSGVNNRHQQYIKPVLEKEHEGAVYVVAGSSSKVDQGPLDHPAHAVGFLEAGSVVIDVVDNNLTARFINKDGQVRDEFSITKIPGFTNNYPGCM